jgi:dinuclear metal center YbgI/SA1388 family protein
MMKIKELLDWLEKIAPLSYQESYDNSGLLVGDASSELRGALLCLDSTEAVIDEAIRRNCNLVIAHHPIIFSGLKKLNGKNYIERTVIKAIQNNIAIYAIHTNLDHVTGGVNSKICEKLGLRNTRILAPKKQMLRKLVTYAPVATAEQVRKSLFEAGAGKIGNYDSCSFSMAGSGTFRAGPGAKPAVGKPGEHHREEESRIEVIYTFVIEKNLLMALKVAHPYEEVAYDLYTLENEFPEIGSGMTGELEHPLDETQFLLFLKKALSTPCIRHTALLGKKVKKIAVCGGAGSFLLNDAIASGSDVFVTADYKYHQFFDADGKIIVADVGHFESEQFTKELLFEVIREKFPTFAVHLSETNTNPVNYL